MTTSEAGASKATPRILLVDDDVDFLEVNRTALEEAGFEVVTAESGEEGLKKAMEGRVDLAVLDVIMDTPDAGFQLARKLRRDARTKEIPLLMLTSINEINRAKGLFTFSDRDRDDTWLPVDRFLEKPLPADCLVPTICDVLSRKAP